MHPRTYLPLLNPQSFIVFFFALFLHSVFMQIFRRNYSVLFLSISTDESRRLRCADESWRAKEKGPLLAEMGNEFAVTGTDSRHFGYISLIVTSIRGRQLNTDNDAWNARNAYRHKSWEKKRWRRKRASDAVEWIRRITTITSEPTAMNVKCVFIDWPWIVRSLRWNRLLKGRKYVSVWTVNYNWTKGGRGIWEDIQRFLDKRVTFEQNNK